MGMSTLEFTPKLLPKIHPKISPENSLDDQDTRNVYWELPSTCKGYCGQVEWNVVLAGDPQMFRLLCNTNLNMNIPSRESRKKRIRIFMQVWANIQSDGYNK